VTGVQTCALPISDSAKPDKSAVAGAGKKTTTAKTSKIAEKSKERTKPVIESRSASGQTAARPGGSEPAPAASPTSPAPQPAAPSQTHQEIGGVVYAKPLTAGANVYSRSTGAAPPKSSSSTSGYTKKTEAPIGQLFAKTGIPVSKEVADRSDSEAKKKQEAEPGRSQTKPSGYPSSKPKPLATTATTPKASYTPAKAETARTGSAETLANMPDITEADRRAALSAAASKILKSEEELMSWAELEVLFGTKNPPSPEGRLAWYQDMADRC
jgi:hypothetical protein